MPNAQTITDRLFHDTAPARLTGTSPIACLVVDAEEDFDWRRPVQDIGFSTENMLHIPELHHIVSAYGVRPNYLLTYPLLENNAVVKAIRHQYDRGYCDIGIQLHPWVTPPFNVPEAEASYLGNLSARSEERKLLELMARFRQAFGFMPKTFRAGRYGLSKSTPRLLQQHEFRVDTSVAPRTDFRSAGGPDYSRYECDPFWFGAGELLELPLCRSLIGWGGRYAPAAYRAAAAPTLSRGRATALLSRSRFAERLTLSPEGNDFGAMRRFLHHRLRRGQQIFSLSFHSSSLWPGRNPYVRDRRDLHVFYDRLSEILDEMAKLEFRFVSLADVPAMLDRPS